MFNLKDLSVTNFFLKGHKLAWFIFIVWNLRESH